MTAPMLVRFDASCPFCRRCARLLRERAAPGAVRTAGVEPLDALEVVLPDGRVLHGARAAAEAISTMGGGWRVLAALARLPGAELAYRLVAVSRPLLSRWLGEP